MRLNRKNVPEQKKETKRIHVTDFIGTLRLNRKNMPEQKKINKTK